MTSGLSPVAERLLPLRLADLRVAVDVQHLYKAHDPNDRGAVFTFMDGTKTTEAAAATAYAHALCDYLTARGAAVLTNNPVTGKLVGYYSKRNVDAAIWHADLYIACHVNAGGGAYAQAEYMLGRAGSDLAAIIGLAIVQGSQGGIRSSRVVSLSRGQRGAPCIQECPPSMPAVLAEPFFGDTISMQQWLRPAGAATIGRSIGAGIETWWLRKRAVAG